MQNEEDQEEEQEELTPEQEYNLRQKEIADEINNRLPRIGDKVIVDKDWTPECGREPNLTIKGRIMGVNYEKFFVSLSLGGGSIVPVYYDALKISD